MIGALSTPHLMSIKFFRDHETARSGLARASTAVGHHASPSHFSAWSGDQFATWGWRIPFALSIILVGVGLWSGLGLLEAPVFRLLAGPEHGQTIPLADIGPALQTVAWL
jgi:hypothetical protein